jgi:hypothetical protein
MEKIIVIIFIASSIIMLGLMEHVITLKKKIYRNYIDATSTKARGGYSRFDGYWFSDDIGLDSLMQQNPDDEWLQKSGKNVKRCQILFFCLFAFMTGTGILAKIYDWI